MRFKAATIVIATIIGAVAFFLGTHMLQTDEPLLFAAGVVISLGGVIIILLAGMIWEAV